MQLPGPIRAAVGLLASAADEARRLPDRAIEVPMLAVSTALQASLRAQQRYARLTARGDAVLSRQRPGNDTPAWATFDEPVAPVGDAGRPPQLGEGDLAKQLLDELFGDAASTAAEADQYSDGSGAVPGRPGPGKSINAPRHTAPSPFDEAGDATTPDG